MKRFTLVFLALLASLDAVAVQAQGSKYPPLSEYLMARDAEIALARSAAPSRISDRATIKILTKSGYEVAREGDNGFVCLVQRGFAAPSFSPPPLRELVYYGKLRAPICFDAVATRTVLPYQEFRAKLGLEGKDPDTISREVAMAYALGKLPKIDGVSFAYMFSADMNLGPEAGAFHPHMMVFAPYYQNRTLGDNEFAGSLPFVSDDAATPFTVVVIPVHGITAIKAKGTQ